MTTLTLDSYLTMPPDRRAAFDDWLERQGLRHAAITDAYFGEGFMRCRCFVREGGSKQLLMVDGKPVRERREFKLTEPPPPFVYEYCAWVSTMVSRFRGIGDIQQRGRSRPDCGSP